MATSFTRRTLLFDSRHFPGSLVRLGLYSYLFSISCMSRSISESTATATASAALVSHTKRLLGPAQLRSRTHTRSSLTTQLTTHSLADPIKPRGSALSSRSEHGHLLLLIPRRRGHQARRRGTPKTGRIQGGERSPRLLSRLLRRGVGLGTGAFALAYLPFLLSRPSFFVGSVPLTANHRSRFVFETASARRTMESKSSLWGT